MDTKIRNCRFLPQQKSSHVGRLSCNSNHLEGSWMLWSIGETVEIMIFQMEIYIWKWVFRCPQIHGLFWSSNEKLAGSPGRSSSTSNCWAFWRTALWVSTTTRQHLPKMTTFGPILFSRLGCVLGFVQQMLTPGPLISSAVFESNSVSMSFLLRTTQVFLCRFRNTKKFIK